MPKKTVVIEASDLRTNTQVYLRGMREECGLGIVEGAVHGSTNLGVRFNPTLFTEKGIERMMGYPALNPHGQLSIIFLIPTTDLIPVGDYSRTENKDVGSDVRKTKRKTR